ncbi:MAG: alpha/beta fold hydrolase [Rhodospirillaceae bacterium]|nr:alpha/beta fold hydrolase [Rhodospirillaceae bacterium]
MTTVVLVHGLWLPGAETWLLRLRLARAGFKTHQFAYRSVSVDLDANAQRLTDCLGRVPGDTVHLLGHSLGGVIALRALQTLSPARIGRVVCLGSPLRGSTAARTLARLPGGRRLIGKSLPALTGGAVAPWSGATQLGLIAGSTPLGGGQLLGGLPRPHDGTIAVEETRLEGATAHIVLPVSHLTMLWSARVADQVVRFLESGRFAASSTSS